MDIRKLQRAIVDGLEDVKGQNIAVFNTEHLSPLFERVIIASGTSNRQTRALAASVRDAVKSRGLVTPRVEGEDNGEWIIVDCGAAVVHLMQPGIRDYYHLEEIWGDKPVRMKLDSTPRRLVKAAPSDDGEGAAGRPATRRPPAPAKTGARRGSTPSGDDTVTDGAEAPRARKPAPAGKPRPAKPVKAKPRSAESTGEQPMPSRKPAAARKALSAAQAAAAKQAAAGGRAASAKPAASGGRAAAGKPATSGGKPAGSAAGGKVAARKAVSRTTGTRSAAAGAARPPAPRKTAARKTGAAASSGSRRRDDGG